MVGQTLGHYRVVEKIGQGGMGVVYRAHDERLDRDVALKVLPPGLLADETARQRFRKEALALSRLNHPNIATVHDFDTQGGADFLVMELIPGATLSEKLAGGALSEKEITRLGSQMAQGLAAAHEQGVVHRDLKPGNLRVTPDGRLKILDFGLATLRRPQGDDAATVTALETEGVAGTLPYMSPEQLRGEKADARSDIYAAGVVLYEMATGRRPFAESGGAQLITAILQQTPPAPSSINQRVAPALEAIIVKALDKEPERRYQSAREIAVDLERMTAPVAAAAPGRRRRPVVQWAWGSVAALVLAVSLYLVTRRGEAIDSLAVLPFANAGGNPDAEYLSDGITETLIDRLSQLPKLTVPSRNSVFRYKGKETDPQAAGRELKVRAVLTGRVTQRGDSLAIRAELVDVSSNRQLWGEQYNRKLADILAVQEEIAGQIADKLRVRLTGEDKKRLTKRHTDNAEAYQLYLKGNFYAAQATKDGFNKGMEHFRQAIALDPNYALAHAGIALAYAWTTDWVLPSREAIPKSEAAARKALELDETLAEAHTALGFARAFYDWNWTQAETEFRRAIQLNPGYARAHGWYAWVLAFQRRFDEALAEARRARELDPLSAEANWGSGIILYLARRHDQAIEQLRATVDLEPNYWPARVWLGHCYEETGRMPEALAEFQKARQIDKVPEIVASLGRFHALSGSRAEAQRALEEVEQLAKDYPVMSYDVALVHLALGDRDQAFKRLEKALEARDAWVVLLATDPRLDPLRSEPRFQNLVRRVGLPAGPP